MFELSVRRELLAKQRSARPRIPAFRKEAVLAHLATHPGDTKRDLARALGVKGTSVKRLSASRRADGRRRHRARARSAASCRRAHFPKSRCWKSSAKTRTANCSGVPWSGSGEGPAPSVLILPGREEDLARPAGANACWRASRAATTARRPTRRASSSGSGASAHRVLGVLKRERGHARAHRTHRPQDAHCLHRRCARTGGRQGRRIGAGRTRGAARRRRSARAQWSSVWARWTSPRPSA